MDTVADDCYLVVMREQYRTLRRDSAMVERVPHQPVARQKEMLFERGCWGIEVTHAQPVLVVKEDGVVLIAAHQLRYLDLWHQGDGVRRNSIAANTELVCV